jgi:diguanylate cyclase (GGDEF)-like protein
VLPDRRVRASAIGLAAVVAVPLIFRLGAALDVGVIHVVGLLAVVGILAGIGLHRRQDRRPRLTGQIEPWLFIVAGVAVLAATKAGTAGSPGAGLSPVRVAALVSYPLLAAGLLRLLSGRLPDRGADVLVQAGLVATVSGLAIWAAIAPERHQLGMGTGVAVLSVALPALDLLLLTITIRLLLLPGDRLFVYRAAALAIGYLLGAHVAAALGIVSNWQPPETVVTLLLACSFLFWALGALDPSMRDLFEPLTDDPPSFSSGHFVLTQLGMLAAPAVIALNQQRHSVIPPAMALGLSILCVLLAAYLGSLLWQRSAIERRAHHDDLTGLPNRTLFADRLSRALAHARRNDLPVALMFVDLDRFKQINDSFGHSAGDDLLRQVAQRLQTCVRDEDTVARLGGDEFALLMPHISGIEGAVQIAERVLATFAAPLTVAEEQVLVTPSLGISIFPQDGADAQHLVEGADAAMYRAKEQGRNTYEIFSPALRTQAHERLALEAALHHALEHEELVLHYQPKVDLRTGTITGAEALVRWNHPQQGLLFPGHFVPLAEQSGQVVALGEFVIATACEQLEAWQRQGLPPLNVSVNISARQLRHGLVDYVAAALRHTGLDPRRLELELTESAALESIELTVAELEGLRAMGVACSLDDFGTGYCGLNYLSRLPIDGLKIDRSFIQALSTDADPIVAAIIALGHSLGKKITAEGVETPDQLRYLIGRGCDEVQGFLFSKAVPADQFARLVLDNATGGLDGLMALSSPQPLAAR